jgi:hypothetical protein
MEWMIKMNVTPRLGIDFGGVIVPKVITRGSGELRFAEIFRATPCQPRAVEKIRSLVNVFEGRVWIVSKVGARMEALARQWFQDNNFFKLTGLKASHLRFCRERDHKQPVCEELAITHFIDDRIQIMQILRETVENLYLFGDKSLNCAAKRWTHLVADWTEAHKAILYDLQKHSG